MARFHWYRQLRGGRWALVDGLLWGSRWVRLEPGDKAPAAEDYTALGSIEKFERFRG